MPADAAFAALGDERFVSLTTFRKSGEPVSTPVWIARDGDALIVTTPAASGKVKRIRNSPRVEVRPCSRRGRVKEQAEPVAGVARLLTDDSDRERLTAVIRRKYGVEFRLVMGIERLTKSGKKARVILAITPA
jgi:PPOX class probable F420-dependent enzyme